MNKYRIVKFGKESFELQKLLFGLFWVNLCNYNFRFDTQKEAEEFLKEYTFTPVVIKEYFMKEYK